MERAPEDLNDFYHMYEPGEVKNAPAKKESASNVNTIIEEAKQTSPHQKYLNENEVFPEVIIDTGKVERQKEDKIVCLNDLYSTIRKAESSQVSEEEKIQEPAAFLDTTINEVHFGQISEIKSHHSLE